MKDIKRFWLVLDRPAALNISVILIKHKNGRIFSIKFSGPMIFSVIFSLRFLACFSLKTAEKNMENFTESQKYYAKHWAIVSSEGNGRGDPPKVDERRAQETMSP